MMVFGIVTLVRGKFQLTRDKVAYDTPARVIGLVLLIPFPILITLTLLIGFDTVFLAAGDDPRLGLVYVIFIVAGLILVPGGVLGAIGIANAYGEPCREDRARRLRRQRLRRQYYEEDYDDYDYPLGGTASDREYDRDRHYEDDDYEDDRTREGVRDRSRRRSSHSEDEQRRRGWEEDRYDSRDRY